MVWIITYQVSRGDGVNENLPGLRGDGLDDNLPGFRGDGLDKNLPGCPWWWFGL